MWRLASLHVKGTVWIGTTPWLARKFHRCIYRRLFGGSSWFMRFRKVATGWPSTTELPRIAPKINSFLAGTFLFITKPASWIAKITYRSYKYRGYSTDIMTMLPKPGSYIFWTSQPQPQILRCGIRRCVSIFQVNPCQPSQVWKLKALSLWVLVGLEKNEYCS